MTCVGAMVKKVFLMLMTFVLWERGLVLCAWRWCCGIGGCWCCEKGGWFSVKGVGAVGM